MKKFVIICMALLLGTTLFAQSTIPVTFQVDLRVKAKETLFVPGKDSVTMHGDYNTDAGLGSNWFPRYVVLSDPNNDTVYSATVNIDATKAGTLYHYKFTINDAMWEGDPNREFTLASSAQTLPAVWFDRDSIVSITCTNTLNFTVDLTSIYGTGNGYFDPATDSILLMGLDWTGATIVSGVRKFQEDPFKPGTFKTSMTFKGFKNDSTKFKTKAYPDAKFANSGWEITPDKWYRIQDNGTVASWPKFVPDIFPNKSPLTKPVTYLFQVNMTNAANRYNHASIDPKTLRFVGMKGQHSLMGAWVGDWLPTDTAAGARNLVVLNDAGKNGDKKAGDNIWSIELTFPKDDPGGVFLYKYGAFYTGSDTLNNAFHPGDNEFQDGFNHYFNLLDITRAEMMDVFGSISVAMTGVPVDPQSAPMTYELGQNYPNPFNPTTTIRYTLPAAGHVSLKLYNAIGQEVAALVNSEQGSGSYSVVVNARRLASGVYFYKLEAGSFQAVRKMMLVK